jgi:hypothetical protein
MFNMTLGCEHLWKWQQAMQSNDLSNPQKPINFPLNDFHCSPGLKDDGLCIWLDLPASPDLSAWHL